MVKPESPTTQLGIRLKEIADALGVSLSQFYQDQTSSQVGNALELLRLYATIDNSQGQQRLMNVARREATRCQASNNLVIMSGSEKQQDDAET